MNIFFLDQCPETAAQTVCDKHVVKMPLESAQMLVTAASLNGVDPEILPYKPAYKSHPMTKWVAESVQNFDWLWRHGKELCREYTERYHRTHACEEHIVRIIEHRHRFQFGNGFMTPIPICDGKTKLRADISLAVEFYRDYYRTEKRRFARWIRNKPDWFDEHKIPETVLD